MNNIKMYMHVLLIHNHFKTEERMILGNYSNGRSDKIIDKLLSELKS